MDQEANAGESQTPRWDKAQLMARIGRSRARLEATVGRLSDAELEAPGPDGGWSVKDHLAHLAAWEGSLLALLEGRSRAAVIGVDEVTYRQTDEAGLNALIYERNRDRPLPEVLADFRQAHERVLAVLDRMTLDDLLKPYSHYQPDDPPFNANPVAGWVRGNTEAHFDDHTAWIEKLIAARGR